MALTQDDAFEFVSANYTSRLATTSVISSFRGYSIEAMDEIRIFLIQLFQTPSLSNTERLVTAGWLCQQIDQMADSNTQTEVDTLLSEMTAMVESGNIHAMVGQLNKQQATSVTLFSILFGLKSPTNVKGIQRDVLDKVRTGLGITAELHLETISDNYIRGTKLLAEDSGTWERMASKYLLNDLIRETFPWTRVTAMEHYRRLLTRFGILRLMLAGVAAEQGHALDTATVVQTIQVFCRIYQHNSMFTKRAENLLTQSEWTQLDRLYSLLN